MPLARKDAMKDKKKRNEILDERLKEKNCAVVGIVIDDEALKTIGK